MPVRLKGIDPRPPGPREPAVPIEGLPTDDEALIRIWRPQAAQRARQGESEHAIARFLHSKGVGGTAARAAARDILADPATDESFTSALAKVAGLVLLILALVVPVLCFGLRLSGILTTAILIGSVLAVAAACRLLWPRGRSQNPRMDAKEHE